MMRRVALRSCLASLLLATVLLPAAAVVASCADVIGLDNVDRVPCVGDCEATGAEGGPDVESDRSDRRKDAGGKTDARMDRDADRKRDTSSHDVSMPRDVSKPRDVVGPCASPADCPTDEACDTATGKCTTTCSPTQACNGGCCNAGTCAPGTASMACGATGAACALCPAGQECNTSGACVCDSASCPAGCCSGGSGGTCESYAAESNGSCGTGGATCAACSGQICNGAGACVTASPQIIPFLVAGLTGSWGIAGCGTPTELGTDVVGATLSATWTDTTNDAASQVTLALNWKFTCTGSTYTVTINGASLGAGDEPATNCLCSASGTTTQTFSSGFSIVPLGTNTLTLTNMAADYLGIMDNGSYALEVTVTP